MIEIKITGNTPLEALSSLTACGMYCASNNEVNASAEKILEAERVKDIAEVPMSNAATVSEPPAESAKAKPPANPQTSGDLPPAADPEPAPAEGQSKPFTLEEVRSASVNAARTKGKAAVRAILQDLGVSSTPDLAPEQYPEFMKRLGELNAG